MALPPPPFPQHFSQNDESSGSGTVGRQTWAIIPPMTRHKATHTGLGTPSPLDRWINAMLRGLAMLVSHVARRFASGHPSLVAECDGDCESMREANVVLDQPQEPELAGAGGQPLEALMVSSERSSRPSNHEGVLRAPSTSHPRARPEDLGSHSAGTPPKPRDLPTGILGTSPSMTRGWLRWETTRAGASS